VERPAAVDHPRSRRQPEILPRLMPMT